MKTLTLKPPILFAIFIQVLFSVIRASAQDPLDTYIEEGLRSNLTLKQKKNTYQQSKNALTIARTYFMPSVNLLADYTSGQGGRAISIPVGDLMNPVYSTLNQLTESDNFPQIENVNQDFFPHNFYDAKIRTSVPLINTDLIINRSISQQKVLLSEYEVNAYQRELVRDIKIAYYNYRAALAAVEIYESAFDLVTRNVAVNESLAKNGKSLPANYLRSKSELEKVKADINSAKRQAENAGKYFNFLLNRPLDSEIDASFNIAIPTNQQQTDPASIANREELYMLKTAQGISASSLQLYKMSRLPKVNAFFDVGSQASNWQYNNDSKYYLLGVQLSVPLFQGMRNNMQIRQSRIDVDNARLNLDRSTAQLQIAADIAANNVVTNQQNYEAAKEQLTAARSYYNLVDKGYQQGVNTLIEFIDARNQLTGAELQLTLRHYEVLEAAAQVERETSSYHFNH
jgi:outer membrane protein